MKKSLLEHAKAFCKSSGLASEVHFENSIMVATTGHTMFVARHDGIRETLADGFPNWKQVEHDHREAPDFECVIDVSKLAKVCRHLEDICHKENNMRSVRFSVFSADGTGLLRFDVPVPEVTIMLCGVYVPRLDTYRAHEWTSDVDRAIAEPALIAQAMVFPKRHIERIKE